MTIVTGIQQLENAMRRTGRVTKREAKDLVTFTAIKFCQSARSRSPGGRQGGRTMKLRELIKNPHAESEINQFPGEGGAEYLIRSFHQGTGSGSVLKLIPTNDKHDKRRKIRRRLLMSESWMWMLRRLGKLTPTSNRAIRSAYSVQTNLSNLDPWVYFENRLKYAAKVAPNIVNEAAAAAARGMEGQLDRMGRKMARAW